MQNKVTQQWLMNTTGFWDVWHGHQETPPIIYHFVSTVGCNVTGSFFSHSCCSYSLITFNLFSTPFIFIFIYIYTERDTKARQREMEHLRTLGVYGLVTVCYANTGVAPNNMHIFTVWGQLVSLSDGDNASFETLVQRHEAAQHGANT